MAANFQAIEAALASFDARCKAAPKAIKPLTRAEVAEIRADLNAKFRAAPKIVCPIVDIRGEVVGHTEVAVYGGAADALKIAAE